MRGIIEAITCGEPRRIARPAFWNTIAQLVWFLPFICLVLIVDCMFGFYATGGLSNSELWLAWAGMVACFVLALAVENIACKVTFRSGYAVGAEGRTSLAEHIRSIATTMMNDFSLVETGMTHLLAQAISAGVVALVTTGALCLLDWRMGLALFVGLPLSLAITAVAQGLQNRAERRLAATRMEQTTRIQEYLRGMRAIKAHHLQGASFTTLAKACEDYRDACMANESATGSLGAVSEAILRSGLACMTLAGVYLLAGGSLDPTGFSLFLLVGTRAFEPLAVVLTSWPELQRCAAAGRRIMSLLGEPEMPGESDAPEECSISFDHVSFGYDGLDERSINPEHLLSRVSIVFQDVYLFQDTIEANIRYGRANATHEEVVQAAKAARCHDFIMELPNGYDTVIGEGGSTLSGGERQRISIARALLKDAPIVLLDEATSALDSENEAEVQAAMGTLAQGRTVVAIAHRLRTVTRADAIYVIDSGRVAESGTHESLLAKGGTYAKLWGLQTDLDAWRAKHPHGNGDTPAR